MQPILFEIAVPTARRATNSLVKNGVDFAVKVAAKIIAVVTCLSAATSGPARADIDLPSEPRASAQMSPPSTVEASPESPDSWTETDATSDANGRFPAAEKVRRPAQNAARPHPPVRRARVVREIPDEFKTEYFWQPKAGRFSAQIGETLSLANYDLKTLGGVTAGSVSQRSVMTELDFRYGFTDQLSVAIQWSPLASSASDTTSAYNPTVTRQASGIGDVRFGILNVTDVESFKVHVGLRIGVPVVGAKSPAPSVFASATAPSADGNMSSGGFSLTALLGFSTKLEEAHHVGGKVAYRYLGQRTFDAQDGTTTTSAGGGAFELAGFYEFHAEHFYVSPILSAALNDASVDTNSGRNSTNDQYTLTTLETDAGWWPARSWLVGAKLGYQLRQESKVGSYKQGYGAPVYGFGTRYEF